jgi:hypothetical protein
VTPQALHRLASLLEARKARDLARLEALVAEDRRLAAEIAEIAATATRDMAGPEPLPLPQQGLRQRWADGRIRAASERRAGLAAGIRDARAEAVQSLGKHRALERLVERADRAAAQIREARAEREAPPPEAPRSDPDRSDHSS